MRRMHINVGVEDIEQSIKFYNVLFGAEPTKTKNDYAKWMLDDPRLNFAISTRASTKGVDHLGLQVDEENELEELRERLRGAEMSIFDEGETVCCYAHSEKSWVKDPSGVAWEAFRTMDDVQLFSAAETAKDDICCAADSQKKSSCCAPSS
jgi:catechol 2,3-dioxygenase-like lactoylglutathione lyase family enzyme